MRYLLGSLWRCAGIVSVGAGQRECSAHAGRGWTVTELGTLGGLVGDAEDINEAGHVVGGSNPAAATTMRFCGRRPAAWSTSARWAAVQRSASHQQRGAGGRLQHGACVSVDRSRRHDRPRHLGELRVFLLRANDINDAGQVVGGSSTAGDSHAFLWTLSGGMVDLGTLGGRNSEARPSTTRACRRPERHGERRRARVPVDGAGGMVDLGTLGGLSSSASDINEAGQVVGRAATASGDEHAFLWTVAGGMVDLGTLGGRARGARRRASTTPDRWSVFSTTAKTERSTGRQRTG